MAMLYEFIPLGDANDKNAGHYVSSLIARAMGQTVIDLRRYDITKSPVLHYGQTESTVEVSNLLNQINTPLECEDQEVPEGPQEQIQCCPAGFSYNDSGACINNLLSAACGTFATVVCGVINAIPGEVVTCNNNELVSSCRTNIAEAAGPDVSEIDPSTICSAILGAALSQVSVAQATCVTAIQVVLNAISSITPSQPDQCTGDSTCIQGTCSNPVAPIDCKKIKGPGKNYEPTTCEFVEVSTNLGDRATFRNPATHLAVTDVIITVEKIECENKEDIATYLAPVSEGGCDGHTWDPCLTTRCNTDQCGYLCPAGPIPPSACTSVPDCKAEVEVIIPTTPKVPYADQIWMSTVIDTNTSFRRIFPKLEEGAPVQCIKEIPANSLVVYSPNPETNLQRINTAGPNTFPGCGPACNAGGQLYFPHLGTIYEYFLKGIQTALRPRGFGHTTFVDGVPFSVPQGDMDKCITEALGDCKMWLFEQYEGQTVYDRIIQKAQQTTCNGKSLNPLWALGIALNENAGLMTNDADGDSPTHFGCNVCEIGTIDEKMECMMNTLRADCAAGKTDEQTLQEYGYPPGYVLFPITVLSPAGAYPPPIFGSDFDVGTIIQNLLNTDWKSVYPTAQDIFCQSTPYTPGQCH